MRLLRKQEYTLSTPPTRENTRPNALKDLWAEDPTMAGFEMPDELHLGHFFRYERQRKELTPDRIADQMSIARRARRLKWIEELEEKGYCGGGGTPMTHVLHALGISSQHAQRWQAYASVHEALKTRVVRSERLIREGERLLRLLYPKFNRKADRAKFLLEYFERKTLAENLGFLMENRNAVFEQVRYRTSLLSGAYLSRNHAVTQGFRISEAKNSDPQFESFVALPLGALLQLWSRDQMVILDTPWGEPLHIVRAVGNDALSKIWIEGILRKSRQWIQWCVPNDGKHVLWNLATAQANEFAEDRSDSLWRHFRYYIAYQSMLERLRGLGKKNLSDERWAGEAQLPAWFAHWAWASLSEIRPAWSYMVDRLEDVCRKPITDSVWQNGVPEFEWIAVSDTARWGRWSQGISSGVNDHRGRTWTWTTFEETIADCIDETIEVPVLTAIVSAIKGDESVHSEYHELRNTTTSIRVRSAWGLSGLEA